MVQQYKSELKFILSGASSTLIDFCLYMLISNWLSISISKVISMTIASIYSFFINKNWTFENDDKIDKMMVFKYIFVQLLNIAVNTTVNTTMVSLTNNKLISFVVATGIAMVVNYFCQKILVFKKGTLK